MRLWLPSSHLCLTVDVSEATTRNETKAIALKPSHDEALNTLVAGIRIDAPEISDWRAIGKASGVDYNPTVWIHQVAPTTETRVNSPDIRYDFFFILVLKLCIVTCENDILGLLERSGRILRDLECSRQGLKTKPGYPLEPTTSSENCS